MRSRYLVHVGLVCCLAGCGDSSSDDPSGHVGGSGGDASALAGATSAGETGASGAHAGGAGGAVETAGASNGGASGGLNSAGAGGTVGDPGGASGCGGGSTSAECGGAGAGGAGAGGDGTAGTGVGGAGVDEPTPAFAADLDKFRYECPCLPGAANHTGDGNCNMAPEVDRQTTVKTMDGDPDTLYDVTFRVRGIAEPNTYTGGTLEGERFYTGGTTTTAGYTSYMLTVAEPAQHYFFNYSPTTGHFNFLLDYEVTIRIRGGSEVTFDVNGDGSVPDGHGVSNDGQTIVPDVPPAPDWYDGQFVQLDVVSVEPVATQSGLLAVAAELNSSAGFKLEAPCGALDPRQRSCDHNPRDNCGSGSTTFLRTDGTVAGEAGTFYNVTLHFRGIVEANQYDGGTSEHNGFYVGGRASNANGLDGGEQYNQYVLEVASPPGVYHLNNIDQEQRDTYRQGLAGSSGVHHFGFVLDYSATIRVEGGTTVSLYLLDNDCLFGRNCEPPADDFGSCQALSLPDVSEIQQPFDGNFIWVDVEDVALAP